MVSKAYCIEDDVIKRVGACKGTNPSPLNLKTCPIRYRHLSIRP